MIALSDLLAANPDARTHGPVFAERFAGFSFDSRIVQPGELFLAVRTDKADGHDYIEAACRGGAAGVLCQMPVDLASFGTTCIVVPDSHAAAERFGAYRLRQLGLPVIGITGSAGKTTAKEMIAHVLAGRYRVFRNPANYSGWYGLPIALGGLDEAHEIAVIEMAVDHFGEMARMCAVAPPSVGVVTLVAPAHLEAFGDVEGIAREKGVLVEVLPADGLAVLNADNPLVAAMAERTQARVARCSTDRGQLSGQRERLTGRTELINGPDDLHASDIALSLSGTAFKLHLAGGETHLVRLPWLGYQFATTALLTIAVCRHHGMSFAKILARLETLPPVPGRLNPLAGRSGSLILDDTYNASPTAVLAGLDTLAALPAGQRIAVLGDMAQLGSQAEAAHRVVGERAAGVVDVLVTRGKDAAWIADAARAQGMDAARITTTYTAEDAAAAVLPHLGPGTIVLAKGSAVVRMEQVVARLLAEPDRAGELLVRQDAAWRQIVVIQPERPTWLEVDLGAIAGNARTLKRLAGRAEVMAVLKADAYGHGAVQVAHTALHNGATWCAVACWSEGEALQKAGIDAPILVLGYTPAWQAREALRLGLRLTVFDLDTAAALSRAAAALEREARLHVKVDTGMHRLGLAPEDVPGFLRQLRDLPGLVVEGLYTHFATSDEQSGAGQAAADRQLHAFQRLVAELEAEGLRPPLVHAANSAALLTRPASHFDLVRPGIALYGLAPSAEVGLPAGVGDAEGLRPALAWKTQVAQVREVVDGEGVGYGLTWHAEGRRRLATIPVGYADGFRRAPLTWRYVLVRGRPAPVVGRVSMDQSAIDVTAVPGVRQGDEVVLIGRQEGEAITAEMAAEWLGTLNYEVVSEILARVPRVSGTAGAMR